MRSLAAFQLRRARKHFPAGVVRETQQWNPEPGMIEWRYDFRFRDPATGADLLYYATTWADDVKMSVAERDERIAEPAIATLERMVHRKCGMDEAIKNQIPLALPRDVPARFV